MFARKNDIRSHAQWFKDEEWTNQTTLEVFLYQHTGASFFHQQTLCISTKASILYSMWQ